MDEILSYIRQNLARGIRLSEIRKTLLQAGWPKEQVLDAISKSSPLTIRTPPQKDIRPHPPPQPIKKPTKKITISNKQLMIYGGAVLGVIIVGFLIFTFLNRAVCGNGEVEKGETRDNCCEDTGCLGDQQCEQNSCIDAECGECQYLKNNKCVDYDCCDDDACGTTQECTENKCTKVECTACEYAENHQCNTALCCLDSGCDDSLNSTTDKCQNPGKSTAQCTNTQETQAQCTLNSECNDNDDSTSDRCAGIPKKCRNTVITSCSSGDNYCPTGCTPDKDSDCQEFKLCTNWACFINASTSCNPSGFTAGSEVEFFGMIITGRSQYEIRGLENNKCTFYLKTIETELEYTEEMLELMLNTTNQTEIDARLEELNEMQDQAEGLHGICLIPPDDLTDILKRWEVGNYSGGIRCDSNGNCNQTGDLNSDDCTGPMFGNRETYSGDLRLKINIENTLEQYIPFNSTFQIDFTDPINGVLVFELEGELVGDGLFRPRSSSPPLKYEFEPIMDIEGNEVNSKCFEKNGTYTITIEYYPCEEIEKEIECLLFHQDDRTIYDFNPSATNQKEIEVTPGSLYYNITKGCSNNESCFFDRFRKRGCII